jgi:hypothetical protein
MLDDLYWVMSYSRWKDPRFWPAFRDALLRALPGVTGDALDAAREHNFKRYHYQGIGRYEPDAVYARGVADLGVLADLLPGRGFLFGAKPTSIDAADLRLHRQHPLLRDRHPAEGLPRVPAEPRGALPVGARPARGVSGRPERPRGDPPAGRLAVRAAAPGLRLASVECT